MRVDVSYSTKANYQVLCVFIHRISCDVVRCPRWFCNWSNGYKLHQEIIYSSSHLVLIIQQRMTTANNTGQII